MCGILAAFSSDNNYYARFAEALQLLEHRGPDDHGINSNDWYSIGHRRLSIIDLSHGAVQPMVSSDGKVSLIFNGEIYNFKELRAKLEEKGYQFVTTSDTEVILYSYIEYGESFVQDFIGMFAIIIVDERNGKRDAVIYRDRMGVKPLYYAKVGDGIIFSSEIKSILHLADQKFELNEEAIWSYLSFRYPIRNNTFFKGIDVIPPGTKTIVRDGQLISTTSYWELSAQIKRPREIFDEQEYIDRIEEIFTSSVNYRTIADVPVGAYLSGGVDSSLIAAKMSLERGSGVHTYTIGFAEKSYNEFEWSEIVAKQYGTVHKEITLKAQDYFAEMERLIGYKDAPLSVPNEVPLYLMSKELKKDITVVLSGEGADEIFGGYGRIFRSADDFYRMARGGNSEKFMAACQKKYQGNIFKSELEFFWWNYSYIKPEQKRRVLSKKIDWSVYDEELKSVFSKRFLEVDDLPFAEKMMYCFEMVHLQGLLSRLDTTTMAASVEGRVPFVDHRLVELAFNIPLCLKLKWKSEDAEADAEQVISDEVSEILDIPKYILKKYGERYLSRDVLYRKKMGFPVPLDSWFGGEFMQIAKEYINDPTNLAYRYFDIGEINKFIDEDVKSHADGLKVWMFLNLCLFCAKYRQYLI